jgi:hypothetical protein
MSIVRLARVTGAHHTNRCWFRLRVDLHAVVESRLGRRGDKDAL